MLDIIQRALMTVLELVGAGDLNYSAIMIIILWGIMLLTITFLVVLILEIILIAIKEG